MNVTQVCIGRFHHFHLARQLEQRGLLREIWTGYPRFKIEGESGIPPNKVHCFPWLHVPAMALERVGMDRWRWLRSNVDWLDREALDRRVASSLTEAGVLVGLSGCATRSGARAKQLGGRHICDRGSSHVLFQNQILGEEYQRWGLQFDGIDARVIAREVSEYRGSDRIAVPSSFVYRSFLQMGVPAEKLVKIPYGVSLDRFRRISEPDGDAFNVLYVGTASIRKGFLYLLDAFHRLAHPRKNLTVIGGISDEMPRLLAAKKMDGVEFLGLVPNEALVRHYNAAHVMVLPSIEEGFGMVMAEALACGCPVIASTNTGAEDLFDDGREGYVVPIRDAAAIHQKLEAIAQQPQLRQSLSEAALRRVRNIGGWDEYGARWAELLRSLDHA